MEGGRKERGGEREGRGRGQKERVERKRREMTERANGSQSTEIVVIIQTFSYK